MILIYYEVAAETDKRKLELIIDHAVYFWLLQVPLYGLEGMSVPKIISM